MTLTGASGGPREGMWTPPATGRPQDALGISSDYPPPMDEPPEDERLITDHPAVIAVESEVALAAKAMAGRSPSALPGAPCVVCQEPLERHQGHVFEDEAGRRLDPETGTWSHPGQ